MILKNRSASFSLQFNLAVMRPILNNNNNNENVVKRTNYMRVLRRNETVLCNIMRFVLA